MPVRRAEAAPRAGSVEFARALPTAEQSSRPRRPPRAHVHGARGGMSLQEADRRPVSRARIAVVTGARGDGHHALLRVTTRFSGFGKPFDGNRRVFRRPVLWVSRPQLVEQLFERAHDIRVPRDEELAARAGGPAALHDRTGLTSDELTGGVVPRVEGALVEA